MALAVYAQNSPRMPYWAGTTADGEKNMKAIGILLAVAAAAVVLLFFVCGFIF